MKRVQSTSISTALSNIEVSMISISNNLILLKSQNGLTFYGFAFPENGGWVALTQNTDLAIQIPRNVNCAIFSYSAGATVAVAPGTLSQTLSAPSGSFTQSFVRINPPACGVDTFDGSGAQLYLHCFSPNESDWLQVGFYLGEQA